MKTDTRLSRTLHALIHLDRHAPRLTSEAIAAMLCTNATVVRRTMAGLREAGHVRSIPGPGGGWELARPLAALTLGDVYRAVGEPSLFALGPAAEGATCLVERAVDARLDGALDEARAVLLARFETVTVADIAADFDRAFAREGSDRSNARDEGRTTG